MTLSKHLGFGMYNDIIQSERSEHTVVLSLTFLSIYIYIYIV